MKVGVKDGVEVSVGVCEAVSVGVGVYVKVDMGVGVAATDDPGAERFRLALSRTRTQSSFVDGVKFKVPVVGNDPIS